MEPSPYLRNPISHFSMNCVTSSEVQFMLLASVQPPDRYGKSAAQQPARSKTCYSIDRTTY